MVKRLNKHHQQDIRQAISTILPDKNGIDKRHENHRFHLQSVITTATCSHDNAKHHCADLPSTQLI